MLYKCFQIILTTSALPTYILDTQSSFCVSKNLIYEGSLTSRKCHIIKSVCHWTGLCAHTHTREHIYQDGLGWYKFDVV